MLWFSISFDKNGAFLHVGQLIAGQSVKNPLMCQAEQKNPRNMILAEQLGTSYTPRHWIGTNSTTVQEDATFDTSVHPETFQNPE